MKAFDVLIENYKTATAGFNILAKIFLILILCFIFLAIIFALVGVVMDFIQ